MPEINWKMKYQELKSKYMEAVDLAFRMGFEQGTQQSQMDSMMQQQQQAQQLQQQQAAGGAPGGQFGNPGDDQQIDDQGPGATMPAGPGQGIQPAESENPDGSELDQHIAKLESMISKSETLDPKDLAQAISELKQLQKSQREQSELRKSAQAIPAIARNMHKPAFKLSVQANHNLKGAQKESLSMQKRIVDDIMNKWEAEESKAGVDILKQLGIEGLTKKE